MKLKFIIIIAFLCIFLLVPINVEAVYRTITVDGDTSDWIGINPSIDDPNENDIDDYYDIDKIYIANDNDNLYFWIQFYGACQVGVGWFWINIYYQDSSTVFTLITDGSSIFSNPDCTGLQVGVSGQDMELGIPLNCIENPQCIYLYTFSFEMIDLMRDYAPDEDVPPVLFQYC
ncbi:MAG: hypothetical protein L6N94_04240, partial [Candidatus Methylarchaceae archaeon HK01M]|nr:hypothetical protein [Candidatus Methylarchaceae archaeon HK01M]